jgi:hypothetical protein
MVHPEIADVMEHVSKTALKVYEQEQDRVVGMIGSSGPAWMDNRFSAAVILVLGVPKSVGDFKKKKAQYIASDGRQKLENFESKLIEIHNVYRIY